jgi:hypothetical protein
MTSTTLFGGARPSWGAAASKARERASVIQLEQAELAAPEDGRTH